MRSKLTFANVMSSIAVFMALGGVSWAATTLPKNSVGAAQIQHGAVTSRHVADGDLTEADFASGLTGAPGARGAAGPAGPKGATGDTGPVGDAGGVPCEDLFCPNTDSPGTISLTIDGATVATVKAFKTECGSYVCSVLLAGDVGQSGPFDTWYAESLTGTPDRKSSSLTMYDTDGTPTFRFHLTDAFPTALDKVGSRFQVRLAMSFLQRVAI
jgi:hypothetical protein